MTEKCFKKCINKPGTSLDTSEQVHTFQYNHSIFLTFQRYLSEMRSHVYGPLYGLMEFSIESL